VPEFAEEIVAAAIEPVPADHTRFVGDVSSFTPVPGE
jgi:3-oxoacyl-[acyl-carrier protein] reductase